MRRVAWLGVTLSVLVLAGCAAVDPDELRTEANSAFDALVAEASAVDTATLRTLDVAEVTTIGCDNEKSQDAFTATGTRSVAASAGDVDAIGAQLVDTLDPAAWTPIRATEGSAWATEDGIVATITADDPLLVIAVFTPCL